MHRLPGPRPPHATPPPVLRARRIASLTAIAGLGAFVALSAADRPVAGDRPEPAAVESIEVAATGPPPVSAAPPPPRAAHLSIKEGVIREGKTLFSTMRAQGVDSELVHTISTAMSPHFDFRYAKPGHSYRLALDERGELVRFRYRTSPTTSWELVPQGDRFRVERDEVELVPRPARIKGMVSSTLYEAVVGLGENGQLARDFADVFAWDIDFQRSVQPGDRFEILYERLYRVEDDGGGETYVRPGRILAAHYEGTAGSHTAVYFETKEGHGGYYRPDGTSVEREFLMAPLRHARISSSYSAARLHPILNVTRPHYGIDYAAPMGTPVWAVADGEVIYRASAGGFGNLVKIRHRNGLVSYYAHLSRFAKGLRTGDRVSQMQVIGYVGQTGLATGPHVCFRIAKDGQYVNPARLRTPAGDPVPEGLMPTFTMARDMLLSELDAGPMVASEESL
jgi:murein DD-endopeptidase MepM/ murein hydrolase activator NlpD